MRKKKKNSWWHPKPQRRVPKYRPSRAPKKYRDMLARATRGSQGKKALSRFRKFWGISTPPTVIAEPGVKKNIVLTGLADTNGVYLADAPEGRETKKWVVRGKFMAATDAAGRRLFILRRKGLKKFGQKPKFVGYARETHYVPTGEIERAGSHKSNRHWVHQHGREEKGRWPKVFKDAGGNYLYAPGTYRVTQWIYH